MKSSLVILTISLGVLTLTGTTRTAKADDAAVERQGAVKDEVATTGPNRTLLHSGIWILGLSYVPAVIVAAESSRDGDKRLYIPVAGPWMDLAARSSCPPNLSCNNETGNKVLIVVDGVFQGIGALDIVGGFIFPEKRTVTVRESARGEHQLSPPSFRIFPARVSAGAYGLAAVGTF